MANPVATLFINLRAGTATFEKDLQKASGALRLVERDFRKIGRDLNQVGRGFSKTLTAPLALIGVAATKMSLEFEDAFIGVKKTVDETVNTSFSDLEKGILNLTSVLPVAAKEIANVAQSAGQLGVGADDLLDFTKTMIQLGETTDLSATDAAFALTRLARQTSFPIKEIDRLGSVIVGLGNKLGATEAQITEITKRLTPVGSVAGLAAEEILAFSGAFASAGVESAAAATAFSSLNKSLSKAVREGGRELQLFSTVAGVEFEKFRDLVQKDLTGAIALFADGLNVLGKDAEIVLDNIEGLGEKRISRSILALAKDVGQLDKGLKIAATEVEENKALYEEWTRLLGTTSAQTKLLLGPVFKLANTVGDILKPALLAVVGAVSKLAKRFNELQPSTQKMVVIYGAIAAAIGPVLIALGSMAAAIALSIKLFNVYALQSIVGAIKNNTLLGRSFLSLGSLISGIGKYFTSIRAAMASSAATGGILSKAFSNLTGVLSSLTGGAIRLAGKGLSGLKLAFVALTSPVSSISSLFSKLWSLLSGAVVGAFGALGAALRGVAAAFGLLLTPLGIKVALLASLAAGLTLAYQKSETFRDVIKTVGSAIKTVVVEVGNLVTKFVDFNNITLNVQRSVAGLRYKIAQYFDSQEAANKIALEFNRSHKALATQNEETASTFDSLIKASKEYLKNGIEGIRDAVGGTNPVLETMSKALEKLGISSKKATAGVQKLTKSFEELRKQTVDEIQLRGLERSIEDAIAAVDKTTFDKALEEYKRAWLQKRVEILQEEKKLTEAQASELAEIEFNEKGKDLGQRIGEAQKQELEQAYNDSTEFWRGLMEDAITGTRFSFEDQFKKAAVEIAARFLAAMSTSGASIGDALGSAISGALGGNSGIGGIIGNIAGLFGVGGGGGGGNNSVVSTASDLANSASTLSSAGNYLAGLFGTGGAGYASSGSVAVGGTVSGGVATGTGATTAAGGSGAALSGSAAAAGSAAGIAAAAAANAYFLYAGADLIASKNFSGTAEEKTDAQSTAAGGAIGTALGGAFTFYVGALLGDQLGESFTSKNYDRRERVRLQDSINEVLRDRKENGEETQFTNREGQRQNLDQFSFGSFANEQPGGLGILPDGREWANAFWEDFTGEGADAFNAVGTALNELAGGTRDLGGQLAFALTENIGGANLEDNLDNIKAFLDSMGITTAQVNEELFSMAEAGRISWQEFQVFKQAIDQLPEAGFAASGSVSKAMQQIINSGGRGTQVFEGFKNLLIEAGEAGITSLQGLKNAMLEAGVQTEIVDALFEGFAHRGIKSLDDLANASGLTLAAVIADMQSAGIEWNKYSTNVDEATSATENLESSSAELGGEVASLTSRVGRLGSELDSLPSRKDITITQTTVERRVSDGGGDGGGSETGQAFARGGIVNQPSFFRFGMNRSLGLLAEKGPEAILPLKRVGGSLGVDASGLGVGSAVVYNVDARGAAPGTEHRVVAAIKMAEDRAVQRSVAAMSDFSRRGY